MNILIATVIVGFFDVLIRVLISYKNGTFSPKVLIPFFKTFLEKKMEKDIKTSKLFTFKRSFKKQKKANEDSIEQGFLNILKYK